MRAADTGSAQATATWIKGLFVALAAVATAVITFLTVFNLVHWTKAQTALVSTEAGALIGLAAALTVHLLPYTKNEPVALAATFTAAASSTLALGTGFKWWHLSSEEISALVALVTAIVGIGTALVARNVVQPTTGPGSPVPVAGATPGPAGTLGQ